MPYRGLAWVMERFAGARLDALNRWFFRTRFPPAIAEPIVAGGFWYAGGATALRSLVGRSFAPRLAAYEGPTLFLNGTWDLPVPAVRRGRSPGRPSDRAGCVSRAPRTSPTSTGRAPSTPPIRRFMTALEARR